jgi:hypothetical protein
LVITDPNGNAHGLTRNATYYLETPTASMTANMTSTRIVQKNNGYGMEFSDGTAPGITFNGTITAPIYGNGEVNFLQTVTVQWDRTGGTGIQPQEMSSHNFSSL